MKMTELFLRTLDSANNAIRSTCLQELDRRLAVEQQEHRAASTCKSSAVALSTWINNTLRPNAFVTLLLPFTAGHQPVKGRRVRDHQFYLNLWTRTAEAALWGKTALFVDNYDDRCLFLFVQETIRQDWMKNGKSQKLTHYHALCRMPARPMLEERDRGMLSTEERCARLQAALVEASKTTPEPYAKSTLDSLRGANIQVKPYRPEHAPYIFKQMQPRYREHWKERPDDALLRDHGLFVLPHLPRRQTRPSLTDVGPFSTHEGEPE